MSIAPSSHRTGVGFVFLATIGWSLSGLFVRLLPELDGWQINAWRGLSMAASLLVYLRIKHGKDTLQRFDDLPAFVFIAFAFCFAAGTSVYMLAMQHASTATVSVIGATSPLITALLSPWITGERPNVLAWVSAVLALCGMGVIARSGLALGNLAGVALSFGVPLTFAVQTLLLRRYRGIDMMSAVCVGGLCAFVFASMGSFLTGGGSVLNVGPHSLLLLFVMGAVQLALPLVFYGWGAQFLPAVTLTLIAMLDAILNPLWTFLVKHEQPETASLVGGAIILFAVLLNVTGGRLLTKTVQ